jgi:hypothetical protein
MLRIADESTDKSDGIANMLRAGRQTTAGTEDSPLRHSFQTGSGVHRVPDGLVLRGQNGRGLKLITYLRLTLMLRMTEV